MIKAILITITLMAVFFIGLLLMPNEVKEIEVPVYINRTINNTIYIYNTTTIYFNETNITCELCSDGQYKTSYVLGLIRQIKRMEKQQDKYFNDSNCNDDLNHTNIELDRCKEEMCLWHNISWC